MRVLMFLSGLLVWVWKRGDNSHVVKGTKEAVCPSRPKWYLATLLGEQCGPDTHCEDCQPDGVCDACDTIDGLWFEAVAEHAQTCDGCGDLTMNEDLAVEHSTHLAYCHTCKANRMHLHGWYSEKNDEISGHYFCKAADGRVVKVTNSTINSDDGLQGYPDAIYVGELVSSSPCQPPIQMTEERAKFVVAFLKRAFSERVIASSHQVSKNPLDLRRGGRISNIHAFPFPADQPLCRDQLSRPVWSVRFHLSGCTWYIDRAHVGIDLGKAGPEMWDLGESIPKLWAEMTAGGGGVIRSTFEPEGGCLDYADRSFWSAAKRALWTGEYFEIPEKEADEDN